VFRFYGANNLLSIHGFLEKSQPTIIAQSLIRRLDLGSV